MLCYVIIIIINININININIIIIIIINMIIIVIIVIIINYLVIDLVELGHCFGLMFNYALNMPIAAIL